MEVWSNDQHQNHHHPRHYHHRQHVHRLQEHVHGCGSSSGFQCCGDSFSPTFIFVLGDFFLYGDFPASDTVLKRKTSFMFVFCPFWFNIFSTGSSTWGNVCNIDTLYHFNSSGFSLHLTLCVLFSFYFQFKYFGIWSNFGSSAHVVFINSWFKIGCGIFLKQYHMFGCPVMCVLCTHGIWNWVQCFICYSGCAAVAAAFVLVPAYVFGFMFTLLIFCFGSVFLFSIFCYDQFNCISRSYFGCGFYVFIPRLIFIFLSLPGLSLVVVLC